MRCDDRHGSSFLHRTGGCHRSRRHRPPRQRQQRRPRRLAVARALLRIRVGGAWLVLLDEPTANLDPAGVVEVRDAVALGYTATACIHPSQVDHIRNGYRPSDEAVEWARKVLDGAAEHAGGVFSLDGQMIDGPVLRQAEVVLSRVSGTRTDPAPEN